MSVTRTVDLTPLRTAIRTALLANSTINTLTSGRVYRDGDYTDNLFPYLAVSVIASTAEQDTYSSAHIYARVNVVCVTMGSPDDGDTIAPLVSTALVDTPFSVTGYKVVDVRRIDDLPARPPAPLQQERVFYYAGGVYRVHLRHN